MRTSVTCCGQSSVPGYRGRYGNALTYTCDDGFSTDATENSGAKIVIQACQETGQWAEVPGERTRGFETDISTFGSGHDTL